MERAFIFDKFNTFYDWGLVLTAKTVTPSEAKTKLIELDGMSGSLDLSEALSGEVTYKDRSVSASFLTDVGTYEERVKLLRDITAKLHGKKVKIIEPDYPNHYFYGRAKITNLKNNLAYAEFTIEATCEPWRYALTESSRSISVNNTSVNLVINNQGIKTVCPTIDVIGSVSIAVDGQSTALTNGSYKITSLRLKTGANVIGVSGNGSVTFTYREADL